MVQRFIERLTLADTFQQRGLQIYILCPCKGTNTFAILHTFAQFVDEFFALCYLFRQYFLVKTRFHVLQFCGHICLGLVYSRINVCFLSRLVAQLVGLGVHPHCGSEAGVNADAAHVVWLGYHCIMPCLAAVGGVFHLVAYAVFAIGHVCTLGYVLVDGALHLVKQVPVGHILRKPFVAAVAVTAFAGRVVHTEHDAADRKVVAVKVGDAFSRCRNELDVHIELAALGQWQVHGDVTARRRDVGHCQRLRLAVAVLVCCTVRSLVAVKPEVVNQLAGEVGGVLHGLLLGIAHVAVCLVVVLGHKASFIVTKQGKLAVHLVEGLVYSSCCPADCSSISRSLCKSFCFANISLCFCRKSNCICCSLLIGFFSLFIAL